MKMILIIYFMIELPLHTANTLQGKVILTAVSSLHMPHRTATNDFITIRICVFKTFTYRSHIFSYSQGN